MTRKHLTTLIATAITAVAIPSGIALSLGRSGLPQGTEAVKLNPADFTVNIDNPYWPMTPGTRWVFSETAPDGAKQRVVLLVTSQTKRIANGVEARVVRDIVTENGVPIEVTEDWFAQDRVGNIWYLGERSQEYVNGKPGTFKGSFEAGVDGAQAGVAMPATPRAGLSYRQEYYKEHAEDRAEVIGFERHVQTPFGRFTNVLATRDLNNLKPRFTEHKFFAKGVGPVMTLGISGTRVREELVSFSRGARLPSRR